MQAPNQLTRKPSSRRIVLRVLYHVIIFGVAFRMGVLYEKMNQQPLDQRRLQPNLIVENDVPTGVEASNHSQPPFNSTTSLRAKKATSDEPTKSNDEATNKTTTSINSTTPRFTNGTSSFIHAVSRTPKKHFMTLFDEGLPYSLKDGNGKSEVLILYNSKESLPSNPDAARSARYHNNGDAPPLLTPEEATANCNDLKVVMLGEDSETVRECVALVGHTEAHHVQRWRRNDTNSFLPVTRDQMNKQRTYSVLSQYTTRAVSNLWRFLTSYLGRIEELKSRLKTILEKIAIKKTVVVLTCNLGQADLLINFACHCRAQGIQVTNVLVFPTDKETLQIAHGLNFTTFYDEKLFGDLPKEAAGAFGDRIFSSLMVAKIVPIHLVNLLGYDLLFQDVDIVWYKNPLGRFQDKKDPLYNFDLLVQDDGNSLSIHGPYRGNAGFFHVRANKRTQYLLMSYLFALDRVTDLQSVQGLFNQMLPEHRSLTGLRVKTLDNFEFPSGHEFQTRKEFMNEVKSGTKRPWIFHMNWTRNSTQKLEQMKSMGIWHVQDSCMKQDENVTTTAPEVFMSFCCSVEPIGLSDK